MHKDLIETLQKENKVYNRQRFCAGLSTIMGGILAAGIQEPILDGLVKVTTGITTSVILYDYWGIRRNNRRIDELSNREEPLSLSQF